LVTPFPPLLPEPVDVVPPPCEPVVVPTFAAASPRPPGANKPSLSSTQPGPPAGQPIADACATTSPAELVDGAAGLVCAPAIAAYKLTATANTARRVPNVRESPFCFFISFS
jgi:hypothetical protein